MNYFWIAGLVMVAVAVASILWPLWSVRAQPVALARGATNVEIFKERKAELVRQLADEELDAESHQAMLNELERSLLEDTAASSEPAVQGRGGHRVLWVSALVLPLLAIIWYWQLGASQDLLLKDKLQTMQGVEDGRQVVELLRARLDRHPDNTQNWFTLARLYMEMGQYADATMAYLEIVNREPEAGVVVAEMAQALFLASNNQMTPEVRRVTQRALQLVPNNGTALGLAGIDAFEQQRFRAAIDYWRQAMAQSQPGSAGFQALAGGVKRAEAALLAAGETPVAPAGATESEVDTPHIAVDVSLAAGVPMAGQTLFVYARAWQGAKMPLAIQRLNAAQLPLTVVLDDSKAMMAGTSLANAGQLEVVARLSASGSPAPQPGDWQASSGPVSLAAGSVALALTIDTQVP